MLVHLYERILEERSPLTGRRYHVRDAVDGVHQADPQQLKRLTEDVPPSPSGHAFEPVPDQDSFQTQTFLK